jgi:putative oxidoreductase
MAKRPFPTRAARFSGISMLALRLFLGAFLIHGVWDNITSAARMAEFARFLAQLHCPVPEVAAPVSVWAQSLVGVLLIPGLFSRWAGVLLAINFIVAVVLIAATGASFRDLYPPAILIFIGLVFFTHGAGPLSVDRFFEARSAKR